MERVKLVQCAVIAAALLLLPLGVTQKATEAQASELVWASYLGGSGYDSAQVIAVDSTGNVWVAGDTESTDFPTVEGFQTGYADSQDTSIPRTSFGDLFVAQITPSGTLAFASYLGGSQGDHARGIAVDSTGNAWITGYICSPDFPGCAARPWYNHNQDAFVARISPSGDLAFASRLGGSAINYGNAIFIDSTGNVWVGGVTRSVDFPTPGGFRAFAGFPDEGDAYAAKITPDGTLTWATCLGGSERDNCQAIAVDSTGNVWMAGHTYSADFPPLGEFGAGMHGSLDAFVALISPSGALSWATCLGGSGQPDFGDGDMAIAVAVDPSGNGWVAGFTNSSDVPAPGGFQTSNAGGEADGYIARISPAGELLWASYLGGSDTDLIESMTLDASGDAWVTGWTCSSDFPTPAGPRGSLDGYSDTFVTRISSSGTLAWTGFLSGDSGDTGNGIAVDSTGNVWVAGSTGSTDFPTPGGFQTTNAGARDAFIAAFAPDVLCLSPGIGGAVAVDTSPVFTFSVTAPLVPSYIVFSSSPTFPATPVARTDGQTDRTLRFALAASATQWQPTAAQWKAIKRIVCLGDKLYWRVEAMAQTNTVSGAPRSLQFDGTAITELAVSVSHPLAGKTAVWPDKKARPSFSWTNPAGALKFFYVDVSTDSSVPLGNRSVTVSLNAGRAKGLYRAKPADWMKIRKLAAKSGGTLYWRVRALDVTRTLKCSSDVHELVIDAGQWTSVGTLDLSLTKPALSWTHAGDGIVRYAIQFSTNEDFSGAATTKATIPAAPPSAMTRSLGPGEVLRLKALCKRNGNPTSLYYRVCGWDADKAFVTYSPVQTTDAP